MEAFVIFDSHDAFFRSPLSAISVGDFLQLRILVSEALKPTGARLRLWSGKEEIIVMEHSGYYDFCAYGSFLHEYSVKIRVPDAPCLLWYVFYIDTAEKTLFYTNNRQMLGGTGILSEGFDQRRSYQITVFDNNFSVPEWSKGAVMYQIFPDRFCRGNNTPQMRKGQRFHENWYDEPEFLPDAEKGYYPACDFFGGSINGIMQKLDYIKSLGAEVIYLNPVFFAYSNHRYDTADYERIDDIFGTNKEFGEFCAAAKEKGLRVIIDGVFSHTGSNSKYFNREGEFECEGAFQSKQSKYYPWYSFDEFPYKYDCWWGVWSLPAVNELNDSYLDYIVKNDNSIVKRWIRAGISGWRLDVADELPDEFITELRKAVKSVDGDALLLGEVWEDASNKISYGKSRGFLLGKELDTVMNYPLRNALIEYLFSLNAQVFCQKILSLRENYPHDTFCSLMNFISTHDTMRITTVLCGAPQTDDRTQQASFVPDNATLVTAYALHKLAALIVFSLPGMPCVYYGDEAGLQGYADPFNRKPYPWGKQNTELLDWYKKLGEMRNEVFKQGELRLLSEGAVLCIKRKYGNKEYTVLINPSDDSLESLLDLTSFPCLPVPVLESDGGMQLSQRENGYYFLLPPRFGVVLES